MSIGLAKKHAGNKITTVIAVQQQQCEQQVFGLQKTMTS